MPNINDKFIHIVGDGACPICRHKDTAVETGKAHFSDTAMFLKFVELNGFATKDPGEIRRFSKKILLDHWHSQNPQPSLFKAQKNLAYHQGVFAEFEAKLKEADEKRRSDWNYARWQATYEALCSRASKFQGDLDKAKKEVETVKAKRSEAPKAPVSLLALFGVTTADLRPAPVVVPEVVEEKWVPPTKEEIALAFAGERTEIIDLIFYLRTLRPPKSRLRKKRACKAQKRDTNWENKEAIQEAYKESRIEHQGRVFGDKFSLTRAIASVSK